MPTWETSTDFDGERDVAAVVHDADHDHVGGTTLANGYRYGPLTDLHSVLYGADLVGWWPLHEQSGQANDLSGQGNHGTLSGPTQGVGGRGGLTAYSFDGSNDRVNASEVAEVDEAQNFTLTGWFYPRSVSQDAVIVGQHTGGGSGSNGRISVAMDTTAGTNFNVGVLHDGGSWVTAGTDVSVDTWSHFALVWDSGHTITGYINGSTIGSGDTPVHENGDVGFHIGARPDAERPFDGLICGVRAYGRKLTSAEIQTLYEWGSGDYAVPPDNNDGGVSYYDFNSANANDAWGSNDGTVNGATHVADGGPRGDGAYSFDGTDDRIELPDFGFDSSTPFSVSAWAKKETDVRGHIIGRYNGSDIWRLIWDDSANSRRISFTVGENPGNNIGAQDGPYPEGPWNHAVGIFDPSGPTVHIYVNGVHRASTTGTIDNFETADGPWIGARDDSNDWFDGEIDDVRIYNVALEPWEVQEIYQFGTLGRDMRHFTSQVVG